MFGKKGKWVVIGAFTALQGLLVSCTTMERRALSYIEELPEPRQTQEIITEEDLDDLPPVVRRYFRFSQVIGKPKIESFGFVMRGRIRQSEDAKWMAMVSRQYNLLSDPARIYYVKGTGTPMSGVDSYLSGKGRMQIKLFNLVSIANVGGPEMDESGLVTFLNDLMFCPPAYFSVPVEWEQIDENHAVISLTDEGITVSATVSFGKDGRIVNWESDDRFAEVDGEQRPDKWSTPIEEYGEVDGLRIPVSGRGVHNFDGNPYTYIELNSISNLSWNITTLPAAP